MGTSVNVRAVALAALVHAGTGCAVHVDGLVEADGARTWLRTAEGHRYRLVTTGEAAPMAALDGHLAHVDGRRVGRAVTVEDWTVTEGLHGMTAWVGRLQWMGAQLGLQDRNSGSFYTLERGAEDALGDHAEKVVLVEGYVVGPNRVKVLYYRVLE